LGSEQNSTHLNLSTPIVMDWQTYTAVGIVTITFVIFLVRLAKPKKKSGGCDHDCGCGKKPHSH
jgi:hypothetical protein